MNITAILQDLKQEQQRIAMAIKALEGLGQGLKSKRSGTASSHQGNRKRTLSAAARARIAAAQRKRWKLWKAKTG
jgi:hypothetical protein